MRASKFIAIFALAASVASATAAEGEPLIDTNAAPPTFETRVQTEEVPGLPSVQRVFLSVGTNQFTFLVPRSYRIEKHTNSKITLANADYDAFIVFRIRRYRSGDKQINPASYRERLFADHPQAEILREFSRTAGGFSGPGFDLQWPVNGVIQSARTVFIPSAVGVLEFKLITNPKKLRKAGFKFNNLLLSFRASENGKLEYAPLSNLF